MKTSTALLCGISFCMFHCHSAKEKDIVLQNLSRADSMVTATTDTMLSSSAAFQNSQDSIHQFIRTADLKFKVKDVGRSTTTVEEITVHHGGFVTYTRLASNIDNTTTIPISPDSSLETTYYNVTNSMVLRVPNAQLDTTLKEIARTVDYLDYRIIKADDVALQLLSNDLAKQRTEQTQSRIKHAVDSRRSKLTEATNAEETLLDKQEQNHQALLANRALADQIQFSTVNLDLYQRQALRREVVFNNQDIPAYEPGFWYKLGNSLKTGWRMMQVFVLFVVQLWWLILLGVTLYYFFYKPFRRKLS